MNKCYHGTITENKCWEIEFCKNKTTDLDFRFSFSTKGDHAGLKIGFIIGKFEFRASIYDHRHWDYETDSWEKY
jgi:hypothetical protein